MVISRIQGTAGARTAAKIAAQEESGEDPVSDIVVTATACLVPSWTPHGATVTRPWRKLLL